ncbi:MAG TPA: hypothetical protein VMF03_12630 [Steroidobacteraceae bacterium]|nr:hypothetical protein [Steroidobacteraceae bacterium]
MKRGLRTAGLGVLVSMLLGGCATLVPPRAPPIPQQARGDPAGYIVVTLRDESRAQAEHPGSTPRGYDSAGHYGVTGRANSQARALERDYGLRQVSAWPIATLHVQCIMFQLPGADSRSTLMAQLKR